MPEKKIMIIGPEEAVFWMDGQGNWRNEHGRLEHLRTIEYLHSSIKHDFSGFYVEQVNGDVLERVYFPYKDTALFVFSVQDGPDPVVILNTGRRVALDPEKLFLENDELYIRVGDLKAKFVKRGLGTISGMIDYDRLLITINGHEYPIGPVPKQGFGPFLRALLKKIF